MLEKAMDFLCCVGLHNWECIGFQGIYFHQMGITNRQCCRCGKKDMRKDRFFKIGR